MQNVYDFDKTIYQGNSSLDFWWFCVCRKPILLRFLPKQVAGAISHLLKRITTKEFKEKFFCFLKGLDSIEKKIEMFVRKNKRKIQIWYLEQQLDNDVIITASPEFLVRAFFAESPVVVIGTDMDNKTGCINGENCKGKEKARRLCDKIPSISIDNFYSDSRSDQPLADIAKNKYFVKGAKLLSWDDSKQNKLK